MVDTLLNALVSLLIIVGIAFLSVIFCVCLVSGFLLIKGMVEGLKKGGKNGK